jgi:hypothetical protein
MQEDTLSLLRRFIKFWPGRHHIEIGGEPVAYLTQRFHLLWREFDLVLPPNSQTIDSRFLLACALIAVMADLRRER